VNETIKIFLTACEKKKQRYDELCGWKYQITSHTNCKLNVIKEIVAKNILDPFSMCV
jgi:hypothetical protein